MAHPVKRPPGIRGSRRHRRIHLLAQFLEAAKRTGSGCARHARSRSPPSGPMPGCRDIDPLPWKTAVDREFGRHTMTTGMPARSRPVRLAMRVMPKLDLNGNIRANVSSAGKSRTLLWNVFDPRPTSPIIRMGPHSHRYHSDGSHAPQQQDELYGRTVLVGFGKQCTGSGAKPGPD